MANQDPKSSIGDLKSEIPNWYDITKRRNIMYVYMYVFYSASVYKVWYNRGSLLILIYNYNITQNHCQPTQVYMPYTYINGRDGLNLL